ncbi:MAG: AAA family ATPase, partial [Actinomycetota bacterium]|nr:AAA family ATPase [Actinomycetota bacterium]
MALENFRQFYGRQSLSFSDDSDRNVTIVYAANGAGKTTLLNAFTWGLYERFTPDFENPEELVNDRAWAEAAEGADVEARATIVFDHENRVYTLDRVSSYRKASDGKRQLVRDAEITLRVIDEDGRDSLAQNPRDSLSQMLPERLHQFFFFNGERIENLVKPAAYAEIEAAIKTVLGLEVIERSVRHLKDARRKLEFDLRRAGSPEDERLHDELEAARKNFEAKEKDLLNARDNRSALQTELEAVDDKMRTLEEARALQEKRDQIESDLETNRLSISNLRKQLAATVNSRGYLAFTETLASRCLEALRDRRSKGEIPTPMKRQFVEDLLERGECICGTTLTEGEKPWAHVAEWRERAGSHEVEEAWNQLSAQAGFFLDSRA